MKTGWVTKRLGEVCEVILGGTPKTSVPEYWGGPIPWLTPGDMGKMIGPYVERTSRSLTPKGLENGSTIFPARSVILSTRAPIGYAFINRVPMSTNQGCKTLVPTADVWPEFLYYNIIGRTQELNGLGTGTTFKELATGALKGVEISLPPLAEQKRIVAKIDAAFEKIDRLKANAERNLANAKELFQSALNEAMRPKPGWVEKRLGEVCSKIGSGATPKGGRKSYCSSGVSLIRSMNVYDHAFKYDELAHINESQAHELDNVEISKNDVLINITGASIARCCVVPADVLPARVNQHVSILRISDDTEVAADFLCYRLISFEAKEALLKIGEAGSTRQALTKGDLESFVVSLPGLGEQKKIIDAIAAAEKSYLKLQSNYTRLIADCAEMRQAVLKEAFEGRL